MLSKTLFCGFLAAVCIAFSTQAARLSEDGTGQVLLLPQFLAGGGWETTIEVRNTDSERARAVRVVFKDTVNGRPTGAINVYLTPGDSWTATLKDTRENVFRSLLVADGRLAKWDDESCTFPSVDSLPSAGLALSDHFLTEDFGDTEVPKRTNAGYVEIYEMGTLIPMHASDCAAVQRRFIATTGAWYDADLETLRNRAIGSPRGGLQGQMILVNQEYGLAVQMDALAIDDFADSAMHTHPSFSRRPSLIDVNPAVSSVMVQQQVEGQTQSVEQVSNWSFAPHAIDALLMSVSGSADYHSEGFDALPFVIFNMPTAPFHNDLEGFYLEGAERVAAPYVEANGLGFGASTTGVPVVAKATNVNGESVDLMPPGGNSRCQEFRSAVTGVNLNNIIGFTQTCSLDEADLRIPGMANRGEVEFSFSGEIQSTEGHVYRGLPIYGNLFQIIRFAGLNEDLNYGWSQPVRRVSGVVTD